MADHSHNFPISVRRKDCKSDDVRRDAFAEWSEENQRWELSEVYDDGYCITCDSDASLVDRELDDGSPARPSDAYHGEVLP